MSTHTEDPKSSITRWRARAWLGGGTGTDAAYGFGGPDVAEAVGTAEHIGTALTCFLDSLERENVEAQRVGTGRCAVRLEVEPHTGSPRTVGQGSAARASHGVLQWEAEAAVGNARGLFDTCYAFGNSQGDEGHLLGTAQEVGAELARVLGELTRGDVDAMKYTTDRFFLEVVCQPHPQQ